eukprot:gene36189-47061_t
MEALVVHMNQSGVVEAVCRAISNLANSSVESKVSFGALGACTHVSMALRDHVGVIGVAEHGCRAICALSANDENRVKLGDAG